MYGSILNGKSYRLLAHMTSDVLQFRKFKFDLRLLMDPTELYYREQYIFGKVEPGSW